MICKRCGKPIKSKSLKCGNCGEKHTLSGCSGMDFAKQRKQFSDSQKNFTVNLQEEVPTFQKKNIALIAGIVAVATATVAMVGIAFLKNKTEIKTPNSQIVEDESENTYSLTSVKFSTLGEANRCVEGPDEALEALDLVSGVYGYTDVGTQFRYTGNMCESTIAEHYIFEQIYNEKKVYGKNMIVTVSKETKEVISISGNYERINDEIIAGDVTAEQAMEVAIKALNGDAMATPEEVILCLNKPIDAWHVKVENVKGSTDVFVDSQTGRVAFEKEENIVADPDIGLAQKALEKAPGQLQYECAENMAIVTPNAENVPFKSKIVSNSLFEMNRELGDDEKMKRNIQSLWCDTVYLLPAEADFIDCVTAADILAENGMLNKDERIRMLDLLKGYHKNPEAKIELVGRDPEFFVFDFAGEAFENYEYEVFQCDDDMNTIGKSIAKGKGTDEVKNYNLEVGKVYCLIITEIGNKNVEDRREEYIYCTDTNANYQLYTQFNKNNGEVNI